MTKIAYLATLDRSLYYFRLPWMMELKKRGYRVYALSPREKFFDTLNSLGIEMIEYKICRGGKNPFYELKIIIDIYKIFKREKFDLVHTFSHKANIYGALAAIFAGTPCVINTMTGLGYIYSNRSAGARITRTVVSLLYRICFNFVKKIIFQNPDDLECFKNVLPDPDRAIVIKSSGVDTGYFKPDNADRVKISALKKELGVSDSSVTITIIARLLWDKGIRELVSAANILTQKYPEVVFLIVGWTDKHNPGMVSAEFVDKIRENPRIKVLGERDDVREVLFLTDIYLFPSYREGTPVTVLEAMAMEKPIITTDTPGCRQTIENGVNGYLVPVKDTISLVDAAEKLIIDKDLRVRMGRESRKKVEREFSSNIVIEQVLKLYKELLVSPKG